MFQVGDVVKIIKVIQVDNEERNKDKNSLIGIIFRIEAVETGNDTYEGQIYRFSPRVAALLLPGKPFYPPFHADELELVERTNMIPAIGDVVTVVNSREFRQVCGVKVIVNFKDGETIKEAEFVGAVSQKMVLEREEEDRQRKKEREKVARRQEKEAMIKKRDAMFIKAKEAMEEASKLTAEIAAIEV
jgi:hypothetical protein